MAGEPAAAGRVSVVVITRNRRDELLANLPRLLELPELPPVIVVDNGSDDGTVEAVSAAHPDVEVAAAGRNLAAAGRNLGVAMATTPYVSFADDDSWWEPGSLSAAVRLLDAHPRVALLAAKVLVGPDRVPDPVCKAMAASPLPRPPDLPGPPVLGFIACGAVVRVAAYQAVGGFDELMGVGGEEQLLAADLAAAGWASCYVDDLVAVHMPSPVRDRQARRRQVIRNELWFAWLRRRWPAAAARTASVTRAAWSDASARGALIDALARVPEVVRRRRPLPAELDQQFARLQPFD